MRGPWRDGKLDMFMSFSAITVRDAINEALNEEIKRDDRVFLIGEEVARAGGAYLVTKGLWKKYGDERVIDSPISEMGFTAFQISCPIVFRGPNGVEPGVAAQHTQDFASWYAHCPGIKVLAPYSAEDAKGLLKAAVRDDNPVVFLEHAILYDRLFPVGDEVLEDDFVLPIGECKVERFVYMRVLFQCKCNFSREGNHITIVSFANGVGMSLEAANELDALGISAEVINLRTLRPLDFETIKKSVMKTRHLVTVEEGWPFAGIGAEISAQVSECEAWDYLEAPILRVCGVDVPMPYAQHLEEEVIPNMTHIVATCEKSLKHKMKK
ncbi:unnamed protein product [Angiostrongylus costaricensis]|uniref:Pyruvate dehydrogenase E1 component subunit beta n=1 Tax=Angiostrongylus costaricensis TaxID=334426 RepID=A0A158PLS7_ANGCS|nr:unnamed protein product [Angiostrongylus costaricensis]